MCYETSQEPQHSSEYRYEIGDQESLCEAVIKAITIHSVDPQHRPSEIDVQTISDELEPLHYSVDVEALEQLFEPTATSNRQGTVTFTYHDYLVTINDRSWVVVRPLSAESSGEETEVEI